MEIVEYRAAGEIRTEKRVVTKVERGEILPGNSDYWEGMSIRVPALPPTNLGGNCSIIDVQYRLEFHVDPSGWAFDLVVKIPIIIGKTHLKFSLLFMRFTGTIPLQQYMPTFVAPPPLPYPSSAPSSATYDPPPGYDSATAPSAPPPVEQFQ